MDKKKLAREIIENVGGIKNIKDINHCVTRLRFNLLSDEKANTEKIENLDGVIGVMIKAGQYQIIIGSEVMDLYSEIMIIMPKMEKTTVVHSKKKIKNYFLDILNTLSSCINGVIPAIVGSGMIKILLIVLKQTGVSESPTYRLLEIIGDAAFYFLPILLAYTASKKFKTDPVLAIVVSSILIHPTLIEWMADTTNITFLGVPVYSATYTSSVIPPILATWILSLIIPVVNKATPGWTKSFLQPAIVLLITVPIVLIVFAPLGAIIGVGLSTVSLAAHSFSPWITMMILSAIMPLLIMTGMHHAFNPIMFAGLATVGFDILYLPAMLAPNFAQGAACLAVAFKSKNKSLKSVAMTSAISASLGGITEPAIFGVTLRLKKPFIATIIGSGIAGIFTGILGIKSYAVAAPGIISMIQFIAPDNGANFINAIIIAVISTVVTFILTLIIGFKDIKEDESVKDEAIETVTSPISGELIVLEKVDDITFSKKMLGDGVAVIPSEGKIYAPFDGTIKMLFQTGHALGLISTTGVEMLIHVGLDTVKLEGKGFNPKIKQGAVVKKGQLLLDFDMDFIKDEGYDIITPIIFTNLENINKNLTLNNEQKFTDVGEDIFKLQNRMGE